MRQDAPDIRREAHVEHPIRLVKHQILHRTELQRPALKMVEDAPRRPDSDPGGASAERVDLGLYGSAAAEDDRMDRVIAREALQLGRGLRRQLPRRHDHQRLDAPYLRVHSFDQRYGEGRRLATPGLRETDDILTIK